MEEDGWLIHEWDQQSGHSDRHARTTGGLGGKLRFGWKIISTPCVTVLFPRNFPLVADLWEVSSILSQDASSSMKPIDCWTRVSATSS